jgi:hypothetical protein
MPWSIGFHDRLRLLRQILDEEKVAIQGTGSVEMVNLLSAQVPHFRSNGIAIRVRRSRIVEDGMVGLEEKVGSQIKDRVVIRYVNDFGEEELGIDSGGLFKDFVTGKPPYIFAM